MEDFKYRERVDGAQEAIKRSRVVFLILIVVSLALLIAAWNGYFSWNRAFLLELHSWPSDQPLAHGQQHLIEEWVKSQTIDVPFLGIHIGISDAAPLGGLAVFILAIWFFFSTRRENRTIAELLIDTKNETAEVKSRIFHGIVAYMVFLTIAESDAPISSLNTGVVKSNRFATLRLIVKLLLFLAPFTILFIVFCDTATIFWLWAPLREGHRPLIQAREILTSDWIVWGSIEAVALILAGGAALLCFKSLRFTQATAKILNEYSKRVHGAARQE